MVIYAWLPVCVHLSTYMSSCVCCNSSHLCTCVYVRVVAYAATTHICVRVVMYAWLRMLQQLTFVYVCLCKLAYVCGNYAQHQKGIQIRLVRM